MAPPDFVSVFTANLRRAWRPQLDKAWRILSAKYDHDEAVEILRAGFLSEDGGIVGAALRMRPDDPTWQATVPLVARLIVNEFLGSKGKA